MSSNPQETPVTPSNPLEEAAEKDRAGNPVRDILKEQASEELKEDEV
jgi:hypothetical protein